MSKLNYKFILIIFLFSLSVESCHQNCKECYKNSNDNKNMKCISFKDDFKFIFNTSNCVNASFYPNYYLNKTDSVLYPCSLFSKENCYECDPYLENNGICLSCNQGFKFNNDTQECQKCQENEIPIIISDFEGCKENFSLSYCDKYITYCKSSENKEIICPDEAPIFNELKNSCHEYECQKNGFKDGICSVKNKKYKDRILFINFFEKGDKYLGFPSYNIDNSGNLMIEINCEEIFKRELTEPEKTKKRKFYFYNLEGRGLFDEINDIYEKTIELKNKIYRSFSTSMALKLNNSDEYRFFLNFESYGNNLEFYDLKTGDFSADDALEVFTSDLLKIKNRFTSSIQLLEANEKNQYLIALYTYDYDYNRKFSIKLLYIFFSLEETPNKKIINIYSLKALKNDYFRFENYTFDENSRFYLVQTKKGVLFLSYVSKRYELMIYYKDLEKTSKYITTLFNNAFYKFILIKDEIMLLCFYSSFKDKNILTVEIFEDVGDINLNNIIEFNITTDENEGTYNENADINVLSENKIAFLVQKWHGKRISIYLINFFNIYRKYIIIKFLIPIYEHKIHIIQRYSLLFKYKDLLGYQFEDIEGEFGFILFGYFNSTDPKQIYNIKKDGLNYYINLSEYLNLQSNVFEYEIKGVKILEIPDPDISGLYLISNVTKNIIKKDDLLDLHTKISLSFSYNDTLKKGNYLFKFAGFLQEPTFETIEKYTDEIISNIDEVQLNYKYKNEYDERRNMNIIGRAALVQINVLNDTKIFCDKKYDNTTLKTKKGKFINCGEGKFYEVIDDDGQDKITQYGLEDYIFDDNKNVFFKCHERCKTCSKEFNITSMNCNECFENYFLRNGNCLQISNCSYNYYYDNNLDIKCINVCPDFKPYENSTTKECIEECNIDELNTNKCNPTNNLIAIKETFNKMLENKNNKKIKKKFIFVGNNVTFIFTTTEIEKNECEDILRNEYLLDETDPIPILKRETLNNYTNNIEVNFDLFNPYNLSQKLDLNLCQGNNIRINLPIMPLKPINISYDLFSKPYDSSHNDICSANRYKNLDKFISDLCDTECIFSNYDKNTKKAICTCSPNYLEKDTENKISFSNTWNIKIVKCFSIIFKKDLFTKNYGFYILFFMNLFNILILIFSPLSKVDKALNKFCSNILSQMKEVFNQETKKDKILITEDNNNNNNNKIKKTINKNYKQKKHKTNEIRLNLNKTSLGQKNLNQNSDFKRKKRIHKFRTIHSSSNSEMKTIKKLKEDKTNIVLNKVIQTTKMENYSV